MGDVKIKQLAVAGNKLLESSEINEFKNIRFWDDSNARCKSLDISIVHAINIIVPLVTLVVWSFYKLESNSDKLSSDLKKEIKELLQIKMQEASSEELNPEVIDVISAWCKKFIGHVECTKKEYSKYNFVIFDDNSPEHNGAFNAKHPNFFPKKNILIKLTHNKTHVRLGVSLDNQNFIEYINIDKKKNMGK